MERKILHVDMDAFFAAIEQLRRPELRGRPLGVGGDGDPRHRGVVSSASYEARAYGIHSAMPLRTAQRKCPHAVFLPVDLEAYRACSARIRQILERYTPLVEPLSIDEAYLDVSHRPEDPVELADAIRRRISQETGLTASVGVGPNKLLAKIASGLRKPDAVTEIALHEADALLRDRAVTVLWGVGPKTARRLEEELGVHTVGDLQQVSLEALQELLGPRHGEHVHRTCRWQDESPVVPEWEPKSMGRETTYPSDVADREAILATIEGLADEVAASLRRDGRVGRTVTLKIASGISRRTRTRRRSMRRPTTPTRSVAQPRRCWLGSPWTVPFASSASGSLILLGSGSTARPTFRTTRACGDRRRPPCLRESPSLVQHREARAQSSPYGRKPPIVTITSSGIEPM